ELVLLAVLRATLGEVVSSVAADGAGLALMALGAVGGFAVSVFAVFFAVMRILEGWGCVRVEPSIIRQGKGIVKRRSGMASPYRPRGHGPGMGRFWLSSGLGAKECRIKSKSRALAASERSPDCVSNSS